jgi:DNA-binding transcriptional ArsR family regulator
MLSVPPQIELQDQLFRALADPTRRAVLGRLAEHEMSVGAITAAFELSQPTISQHLGVLRSAGLVTERREGRFAYYRADPDGLQPLFDWLAHYQQFWRDAVVRLDALLKEIDR